VLPFAFANLPPMTERQVKLVLYVLVWAMVCLCIGVMLNTAANFDLVLHNLNHGRPVPVPRNHIRFSLLIATAILSGGWLWQQRFTWHWAWERKALSAAILFLLFCIHVLAVRSALAALYAALFFTVGFVIVRTRRWALGLAAALVLALTPLIAYYALPSLQHRISYMIYDWQQYRKNEGGSYSDAQRWVSLETGLDLWRKQPWIGVGVGDLPMEVQQLSNERFPNYTLEPKLPHNQFIYILCGTGLLGLFLSLIALSAPFGRASARRFYLFLAFQVMIFVSFLVEYTLETAIGVAFYLFYTLWLSLR
jgi:O-antigen ligase